MNDEQMQAAGEWMSRIEALLQSIDDHLRRIQDCSSATEAASGDLLVKAGALFQAVDGIQAAVNVSTQC
jgi:hypothetical protein